MTRHIIGFGVQMIDNRDASTRLFPANERLVVLLGRSREIRTASTMTISEEDTVSGMLGRSSEPAAA